MLHLTRKTLATAVRKGGLLFGLIALAGAGCGMDSAPKSSSSGPVGINPAEAGLGRGGGKADGVGSGIPDVQCGDDPVTDGTHSWNNLTSYAIAALGSPRHRGIDLIASADDGTQTLTGAIKYGITDKSL